METVNPPEERTCERCGRVEHWDDGAETWVATGESGEGNRYCVHEWDITGSYNPLDGS